MPDDPSPDHTFPESTTPTTTATTETDQPDSTGSVGEPDAGAEVTKWKHFARKNERDLKKAQQELEELRQAGLSEQERAVADARAEGRAEAIDRVGKKVAHAELRARAAEAEVTLPDLEFLDLSRFVTDDGDADSDAITAFIGSLPATWPGGGFAQDIGLGRAASAPDFDPREMAQRIRANHPY